MRTRAVYSPPPYIDAALTQQQLQVAGGDGALASLTSTASTCAHLFDTASGWSGWLGVNGERTRISTPVATVQIVFWSICIRSFFLLPSIP